MRNEVLFLLQTMIVSVSVVGALRLGKEALVATITILIALANLFVVKQATLFGLHVTVTDAYIVGAVLGFNLLQEHFGKEIAKKTIWISFFLAVVFCSMAFLHVQFVPNEFDSTHLSFVKILDSLPRIIVASFVAHLASQYVRLFLYDKVKEFYKNLFVRNFFVTVVEQMVDTALFSFVGLYGVVHSTKDVFLLSFGIKLITIAFIVPIVVFISRVGER